MKKIIALVSLPVIATGVMLAVSNRSVTAAFAEGEESSEVSVVVEEEPTSEEMTEEEKAALEEVKGWLSQHFDSQMVANIITWVSEAGVLVGLLGVYVKYRKWKYKTVGDIVDLVKAEVGKYLSANFDKLSEEKLLSMINAIDDLEKSNEIIMKVLVLMQDNTKKGKIALLDFLGSKTTNEEVKVTAEELSKDLEEQVAKEEQVKEAVSGEYENIF